MTESMADKWHGEVMKTQRTYALLDYGEGVLRFGGGAHCTRGEMAVCLWNANLCQAQCTVFYTYYTCLPIKLNFMVEQQGSERPRCLLKVKAKMSAEGQQ